MLVAVMLSVYVLSLPPFYCYAECCQAELRGTFSYSDKKAL
jgi:hypothetical protein